MRLFTHWIDIISASRVLNLQILSFDLLSKVN